LAKSGENVADFSKLIGVHFLATQVSRGSVTAGTSAGFYQFTEANLLADQSAIVGTYGANATITITGTSVSGGFIDFTGTIVSSNFFANGTITGNFLGNDATDFLLNAQSVPGVGSAFLYVTNTPAQQPGTVAPNNTAQVSDVLNNVAYTSPACFADGTLIETTRGPVAVESLSIGDQVVIHDADRRGTSERTRPIVWIGHRAVECTRHPRPGDVLPVRVRTGAFGDGMPRRDLLLSPDHAVYIDGVLIPIKHLLSDDTIAQISVDQITYYHIELSSHDVMLAEGLPVESYLDTGDRDNFLKGGRPIRLFPDFSGSNHSSLVWEAKGCAPLKVNGPEVEATRVFLAKQAEPQPVSPQIRRG
jgi:Hint domain